MSKVKSIEQDKGKLSEVIPEMVNRIGQVAAAKELGLSPSTVNTWLKRNGYVKKIQYVKNVQP